MGSSILGVATLAGGVANLWGLQESSDATTAGDVSGVPGRPSLSALQYGADGTLSMGASGVMGEGVAAEFAPDFAGNGIVLANSEATFYVGGEWSAFAQFAWSGSTGVDILRLGGRSGPRVVIRATPTQVQGIAIGGEGVTRTAAVAVDTRTGSPHWVCLVSSGGVLTLTVDSDSGSVSQPASMGTVNGVEVGSVFSADPVQVAWAGFADTAFDAARVADLTLLATGGSERSDERVARVLRWLGLYPDADIELGAADVAYQPTTDRDALEVIEEVNAVERGLFVAMADGRLQQQARAHRYNNTPKVTLAASDTVTPEVAVEVDLTRVVNDVTASRPSGAAYRAIDADSVATYGPRTATLTIYAASDDELRDAASAMVGRNAQPSPRMAQVTINLLAADTDTAAAVLGVGIGDMVRITGLPATAPGGTSVDLYVEGVADEMSSTSWTVTWSTSPATYTAAWILGDSTYSVLGTTTILV